MNLAEQLKEAQSKISAMEEQTKTLTAERDQAAEQVKTISAERDEAAGQVTALTAERDQATEQVKTITAERDQAKEAAQAAEKERDTVKAQLALSPGHKDLSAGTDDGASGTQGGDVQGDEAFLKAYKAASPGEKRRMWNARMKGGFARLGALAAFVVMLGAFVVAPLVARAADKVFDQVILETSNAATGTVATTVSDTVVGTIESITVIVPTGVTCDVAVASSYLTLFDKDDCTGTTVYRPRFLVHDSAGAVNTNTTDKVDKAVVIDTVTASFDECSTTNQSVKALVNFRK